MKGHTNNPFGRKKGVPNKMTADLRSRITDFLSDEWEQLIQDFKLLEPKERLFFYEKLLQYCLPKGATVTNNEEATPDAIIFEEIRSYEIDLEKIPYPELKKMIEESETFMSSKNNSIVKLRLPQISV